MTRKSNYTDSELLCLLETGNPAAFESIYRRYARELYSFSRRNIPTKEDCEEIVQDIFESLWKRRDQSDIQNLRTYLYNAVRYKVIRYFHHHGVRRRYAEHYRAFETQYEAGIVEPEPEGSLYAVIERSLGDLPERCQLAFRLRLYENLSNAEIAERMNISKKTVELYMFKAFARIRANRKELFPT